MVMGFRGQVGKLRPVEKEGRISAALDFTQLLLAKESGFRHSLDVERVIVESRKSSYTRMVQMP
jgi:hypothetical protein